LNLLKLDFDAPPPEQDRQLPLFEPLPDGVPDPTPHLIPEMDEERASIIGRETFAVSLLVHIAIILFMVAHPDLLFMGGADVIRVKPEEQKVTMLYEPPLEKPQPKLQAPPPPPKPMQLPRAAGSPESQLDKIQPPPANHVVAPPHEKPSEPRGPKEQPEPQVARMDPIGIPDFPDAAKEPSKQRPSLQPVPKEAPTPSQAQLELPQFAPPSRGTDAILREMAKQHAEGGGRGLGGGFPAPSNSDPNFNLPGPQILSDTMGVDFDPYLLRVYLSVQRNWYSVIPEIARLGRKGRTILQFTIMKDGSVQGLQMMDGSGTASMDAAAQSSIRLSNPFPPLPTEFPGDHILLRFGYYYNMQPDYSGR
jgi:TonB family protein